jgi:hypothetical protein
MRAVILLCLPAIAALRSGGWRPTAVARSSSHMALSRQIVPERMALAPLSYNPPVLPPVGATFTDTMLLPVIGLQTVRLSITSRSLARIQLSGALRLNEVVSAGVWDARPCTVMLWRPFYPRGRSLRAQVVPSVIV